MEHPQPAVDLLTSLPSKHQNVLLDWEEQSEDAEVGDDIRNHPEIWEGDRGFELPDSIEALDEEDRISLVHPLDLSLNAIAIGLGLEDIEYEPNKFSGLIYHTEPFDATIFAFLQTTISIGDEQVETLRAFLDRLNELGLADASADKIETKSVAEIIQ